MPEKLYFFMLMNDAASEGSFANFNRNYRQLCKNANFHPEEHKLLDLLSDVHAKFGKIDVTQFVKRVGGCLTEQQSEMNALFRKPVVYPLRELIDQSMLNGVQARLKIKTPSSLVTPSQLASTNVTGNIEITLNIDDFKQIYAEDLVLMEGEKYAFTVKINSKELKLMDIPIGGYIMILPAGKSSKYDINKKYAIVKYGDNKIAINYHPKNSSLISQGFRLLGISDKIFASIDIDLQNQIILFQSTNKNPHNYFPNKQYAQVTVKNSVRDTLFEKSMEGTNIPLSPDKINFNIGDQLEIFHAEPKRLKMTNGYIKDNADFSQLNTFVLTKIGLENELLDPRETLKMLIHKKATQLRENHPEFLFYKFAPPKDDIYLAINNFTNTERKKLLEEYSDVIPKDNGTPGGYISNHFNIQPNGLNFSKFFTATIDRVKRQVTFETKQIPEGSPHTYFPNQTYAYVSYVDVSGTEKYKHDFIGNLPFDIEKSEFQISDDGGEQLYIHHKEAERTVSGDLAPRFILNNTLQHKLLGVSINNIYRFTRNGMEVVKSSDEDHFDYPLMGTAITQAMNSLAAETNFICSPENTISRPGSLIPSAINSSLAQSCHY